MFAIASRDFVASTPTPMSFDEPVARGPAEAAPPAVVAAAATGPASGALAGVVGRPGVDDATDDATDYAADDASADATDDAADPGAGETHAPLAVARAWLAPPRLAPASLPTTGRRAVPRATMGRSVVPHDACGRGVAPSADFCFHEGGRSICVRGGRWFWLALSTPPGWERHAAERIPESQQLSR
jgi:hypothetical protein